MSWGRSAVCVEVNGTRYNCYCNAYGVEAFSQGPSLRLIGMVRAGYISSGTTDDEVAAMLRDLEVKIVAHAYGVDPSFVSRAIAGWWG